MKTWKEAERCHVNLVHYKKTKLGKGKRFTVRRTDEGWRCHRLSDGPPAARSSR